VFEEARSAVDALRAIARELDPACLDGRDAAALFAVVTEGERVCGAIKALLARRVEETKVWREGGHHSAAHWVAAVSGETVGASARTLETARALDALPATEKALRAGQLSETQAAEITSAAGADPGAETALLETAGSTSVKGLRDHCRQVRAGAEVDDRAWARRLHIERRAHEWTDPDGAYHVTARMAPDAGARSARRGTGTSTGSSVTPAGPAGASPAPPTPPMRSSRSPAKAPVSRSTSASPSTAPRWLAGIPTPANSARSLASARYP